jgi:hypothetical protein
VSAAAGPASDPSDPRVAFLIAGVQKGGTTTLHGWLRQHPRLAMSRPKEVHFFDDDTHFAGGAVPLDVYHAHFAHSRKGPAALRGESTPSYCWWPGALDRVAAYNPAMRLILLLRCPLDRAWSHYRMSRERGFETEDFLTGLRLEPERLASPDPWERRRFSYASRGFYAPQIRRARALFPADQLLFLRSRDLQAAPGATLDRICDFLGVERLAFDTRLTQHHGPDIGPMPEDARAHLRALFAEDRREVEALLGWDCADWLR